MLWHEQTNQNYRIDNQITEEVMANDGLGVADSQQWTLPTSMCAGVALVSFNSFSVSLCSSTLHNDLPSSKIESIT
eukprot:6175708-Pleurochrysis_carterae.AAC.1